MPRTQNMSSQVDLDRLFRRDSKARVVAERLLTGRPQTRQQLVEGLGISVTSVNRVVEDLARAGVTIIRDVAEDGRQAVFQVVEVGIPVNRSRFPGLGDEVEITGAYRMGDAIMVDMESDRSTYRGELKTRTQIGMVPLGKKAVVVGLKMAGEGLADLSLEDSDGALIEIETVRNTTAAD